MDCSGLFEALALDAIVAAKGELPPCNARWEGYFVGRLLPAMVAYASGTTGRRRGLRAYDGPASLSDLREGAQENGATWCDFDKVNSLGWRWPDAPVYDTERWTDGVPPSPGALVLVTKSGGRWCEVERSAGRFPDLWSTGQQGVRTLRRQWDAIDDEGTLHTIGSAHQRLAAWLKALR